MVDHEGRRALGVGLAAIGLGVGLHHLAAAATVFDTNRNASVYLGGGNYLGGGPFTITAGTTINGGVYGLQDIGPASIINHGRIVQSIPNYTAYAGVGLLVGGSVSNFAGGTIIAGGNGIVSTGSAGSVDNAGLISGGDNGISLNAGGSVVNQLGGTIHGNHMGVYSGNGAGSVTNAGLITAVNGTGVSLYGGGSFTNTATGIVSAGYAGAYLRGDGALRNAGTISGAHYGVDIAGSFTVVNQPGGIIAGQVGLQFNAGNTAVFNAGTIASTDPGGNAVAFGGGLNNVLTLTTGSVIDGAIEGGHSAGQIELTGSGTLNSDVNDFGLGSQLAVQPGADWTGTGSWHIATLADDGVLQPGAPGTPLLLTGNFMQGGAGTLRIVVTPAASSQFVVTGTASLAGNLQYSFAPGSYGPHDYQFLSASGGISGAFTSITYNGAMPAALTHATGFSANGVALTLAAVPVFPAPPVPPTVPPTVPTPVAPPAALTVPPPDPTIAVAPAVLVRQARFEILTVAPADDALFAAQNQAAAGLAQQLNGVLLGRAMQTDGATTCRAAAAAMPKTVAPRMAMALANAFCGAGGWIDVSGTGQSAAAGGGAPGHRVDTGGFLAGIGRVVNRAGTRLGLTIGYDEASLRDKDAGHATADTTRIGIYGAQPLGLFTLAADFLYGHENDTSSRATGIGQAVASRGGQVFAGGFMGAFAGRLGSYATTPQAGIRFVDAGTAKFAEGGGGYVKLFALRGAASHYASVQPFLNLEISRNFLTSSSVTISPALGIGYQYEAGDAGKAVALAATDGTIFTSARNKLDRNAAMFSAGLVAGRRNWAFHARYTADVSGNWAAQTAEAGMDVKF